jgi:hypothetical protein
MSVFVLKIDLMTSISLVIKQKVLLQKCRFPAPVEKRSGDDNLSRESFMPLARGTIKDERRESPVCRLDGGDGSQPTLG